MSELSGVRRETARREYQVNSQTRVGISRWMGTLERNLVKEETQHKFIEYSVIICQEGIEKVREHTRATHSEVLESLRESQGC